MTMNSFAIILALIATVIQGFRLPCPMVRLSSLRSGTALQQAKKYCVSVNLYVKSEHREEFLRVIRINSAGTRTQEPLNHMYMWGESTTEPNTFHFQEQFLGEEGFVAHTQAPHFQVWAKFADVEGDNSPFWRPPEVKFFTEME